MVEVSFVGRYVRSEECILGVLREGEWDDGWLRCECWAGRESLGVEGVCV